MANLRKMLAGDITGSSLKASTIREVPLDRIYALASASPLGASLWRLKYAHDAKAYHRSVVILSAKSRGIAPKFTLRLKLCKTVLTEWLDEHCRACGGRRFVMAAAGVKHVCTVCDGTGLRRYSDQWRMRQMGLDQKTYLRWERKFAAVHQKIADADLQAWRAAARQLGWIPTEAEEQKYLEKYEIRATLPAANADCDGPQLDYMATLYVSSATA